MCSFFGCTVQHGQCPYQMWDQRATAGKKDPCQFVPNIASCFNLDKYGVNALENVTLFASPSHSVIITLTIQLVRLKCVHAIIIKLTLLRTRQDMKVTVILGPRHFMPAIILIELPDVPHLRDTYLSEFLCERDRIHKDQVEFAKETCLETQVRIRTCHRQQPVSFAHLMINTGPKSQPKILSASRPILCNFQNHVVLITKWWN